MLYLKYPCVTQEEIFNKGLYYNHMNQKAGQGSTHELRNNFKYGKDWNALK